MSLSPRLAAQCGYSLTVDFLGNAKFLASVLSCFAQNTVSPHFISCKLVSNGDMLGLTLAFVSRMMRPTS